MPRGSIVVAATIAVADRNSRLVTEFANFFIRPRLSNQK
jgi:hypothetical protein